jgi:hypothetical protein
VTGAGSLTTPPLAERSRGMSTGRRVREALGGVLFLAFAVFVSGSPRDGYLTATLCAAGACIGALGTWRRSRGVAVPPRARVALRDAWVGACLTTAIGTLVLGGGDAAGMALGKGLVYGSLMALAVSRIYVASLPAATPPPGEGHVSAKPLMGHANRRSYT